MYIEQLTLENIRNFKHFCWALGPGEPRAGWHVLLGDNGAGKSTVLKACAMALLEHDDLISLRLNSSDWVNGRGEDASISLRASSEMFYSDISMELKLRYSASSGGAYLAEDAVLCNGLHSLRAPRNLITFFSSGFGPFRRFSGGSSEYETLSSSHPRLARHLSLFGEDVALTETLSWLKDLDYQSLDALKRGEVPPQDRLLEKVISFINQDGLLPNETRLTEISPRGVIFTDITGTAVALESLSDGFRSVLSLTLELIRQLSIDPDIQTLFSEDDRQVIACGVVLIDEVDVHLHPRWQRSIGSWMTKHFPNIQFIVTTHSPLVCQGAMPGTVTRLPQPGVEGDDGERMTGVALDRLLYGDILEAISSGAFGSGIERSEEGQQKLQRLALLNRKARRQGLDDHETEERQRLQAIFGSDPD